MKKIYIIIIVLLLIIPFNINAEEIIYGVIGKNIITDDNLIIEDKNGGSAIYDKETNTLTLNNFNINEKLYENKSYDMLIGILSKNGTIELIGDNIIEINTDSNKNTYILNLGYDNNSKEKNTTFNITGNGKLTIKDNTHSNNITYINSNSSILNIDNSKIYIDIICTLNDTIKMINTSNYLDIKNSTISLNTSKGTVNNLTGIYANNDILMEDSNIKITLGNSGNIKNITNIISNKGNITLLGNTIKLINYKASEGILYKCNKITYDETELVLKDFKYTLNKNGEILSFDEIKDYNVLKGYYLYNKSYSYETVCETCIINNGTKNYTLTIDGNYKEFKELSIDGVKYINNIDYEIIGKNIEFTKEGLTKLSTLNEGVHKVQIEYLHNRNSIIDLNIKNKENDKDDPLLLSLASGIVGLLGLLGISIYIWRKYYKT